MQIINNSFLLLIKNTLKYFSLFLCLMILTKTGNAQEEKSRREQERLKRHRITVMIANSHIPSMDAVEGQNKFSIVPTWGVDYDFWFSPKWAIGLHNDLILQQYKIKEEKDNTVIERSFPIGTCLVGIFKPFEHLSLVAGIGKEFEKSESFGMWKVGVEYGFELPESWELSLNLQYDNKINAYDSWLFGLGVSKSF